MILFLRSDQQQDLLQSTTMLETVQKSKEGKFIRYLLHNQAIRVLFFEFIGTTFLMFAATSIGTLPPFYSPENDHLKDSNPFRLVYVVIIVYSIICFIGPFTGAHINPAVTLMAYLQRKKNKGQVAVISAYFIAQFFGGLLGTILSRKIYGNGGAIFVQMPAFLDMLKLSFQQLLGTFVFLFLILIITTNETSFVTDQAWIHLSIALAYYLSLTLASRFHSLNPAVIFSVQAEAMINGDVGSEGVLPCLILIGAQFLGGGLADLFFRKFYVPVYKTWKQSLC